MSDSLVVKNHVLERLKERRKCDRKRARLLSVTLTALKEDFSQECCCRGNLSYFRNQKSAIA